MAYKIYTDKNEDFICEVSVKNASLKNSIARLVVESADGINFVFNGKIEGEKCIIPIRRLKGFLEENSKGNMHLEIIVEDTYFKPWESNFIVEEHTSVKVKVNETSPTKQSTKPLVEVKVPSKGKLISNKKAGTLIPLQELTKLCDRFSIQKRNISKKKNDFRQIVNEYFNANPEYIMNKRLILAVLTRLLK